MTSSNSVSNFADALCAQILAKKSIACVGIDPRYGNLPASIKGRFPGDSLQGVAEAYLAFSRGVIDAVADLVPVVKPQSAFFEQAGPAGVQVLAEVTKYAQSKGLLVIMDAKRGDIGTTAEGYAEAYLANGSQAAFNADSLTINPYMGSDTLVPFTKAAEKYGKGLFVLVKTSNPGSATIQDLVVNGSTIYEQVADIVEDAGASSRGTFGYSSVGAVVGATYPEQLVRLRARMPHTIFLIPGFGAQGGRASDVMKGVDSRGLGAVVNNSRGIIFAYEQSQYSEFASGERWTEAVRLATQAMNRELSITK